MYRIGVVGVGDHGTRLAADAATTNGVDVVALAEVDEERRHATGEAHGVPESARYGAAATMIDGASLDAVVIASPPAFHHEQIVAALDAGLHVCCEKPLVVTAAAARDVAERVDAGSEVLLVGYQRHWNPGYVAARERWHGSDLVPQFASGELVQDWTHHFASGTDWRTDPEVAGRGHLFGVGTHVLESMLWTTGLVPESVSAEMDFFDGGGADDGRRRGEPCIDTQSSLSIRFESGATATMADCATATAHREHLHVWDHDGGVVLEARNWESPRLTLVDVDGTERTPDLDHGAAPSTMEVFVEGIETGEPAATAADALRVTALLEAAYESARTGERVAVEV